MKHKFLKQDIKKHKLWEKTFDKMVFIKIKNIYSSKDISKENENAC